MMAKKISLYLISAMLVLLNSAVIQGCSKYTVITSQRDPADSYYKEKIMASYFWGTVNNPHRAIDSTCGSAGLDEVKISTNVGYSLLHVVTLGIVNVVKVQWKCHKPAPLVGHQP